MGSKEQSVALELKTRKVLVRVHIFSNILAIPAHGDPWSPTLCGRPLKSVPLLERGYRAKFSRCAPYHKILHTDRVEN